MKMSAHDYPQVYSSLGIDLTTLGVLMLDTASPLREDLPSEAEYISPDPAKFWVHGALDNWHVTALYGFLPDVRQEHVKAILADVKMPTMLNIDEIEVFDSPYEGEPYDCVVATVESKKLRELNAALTMLPHVNTFVPYKPHITPGYFARGWAKDNKKKIKTWDMVPTLGYNFGSMAE